MASSTRSASETRDHEIISATAMNLGKSGRPSEKDYLLPFGLATDIPYTITTYIRPTEPCARPGNLSKLSNELLIMILKQLDIHSYFKARHVCRSFRMLATNEAKYRLVVEEAADSLIGALHSGMASWVRFADIYTAMCLQNCQICGMIGCLIYLPTVTRCCKTCLFGSDEFRLVTLASFARAAKSTKAEVRRSVKFFKLYRDRAYHQSCSAINFAEATKAMHTSPDLDVGEGLSQNDLAHQHNLERATSFLPFFDEKTRETYEIFCCLGCATQLGVMSRNTLGAAPDREMGREMERLAALMKICHRRSDFLAHFKECPGAQQLWKCRQERIQAVMACDLTLKASGLMALDAPGLGGSMLL